MDKINKINAINHIIRHNKLNLLSNDELEPLTFVLIGTQSAGKSSTLNNILGIPFLRTGKGMVTRTPINITVQSDKNERIEFPDQERIFGFNEIDNVHSFFDEITNELTNSRDNSPTVKDFKGYTYDFINDSGSNITTKSINVIIYLNKEFPPFNFVDLPGLILVPRVDQGQPQTIVKQIEDLLFEYINKNNTMVLVVAQAKPDLETDVGLAFLKRIIGEEKQFKNYETIGVLTKPDLMNQDSNVCNYLTNNMSSSLSLTRGYYVVNNTNPKYFDTKNPYASNRYKGRTGFNNLFLEISETYTKFLNKCLETMHENTNKEKQELAKQLNNLKSNGLQTKQARIIEISKLTEKMALCFNNMIETNDIHDNFGVEIKNFFEQFKFNIEQIEPFDEEHLNNNIITNVIKCKVGYHMESTMSPIDILEKIMSDQTIDNFSEVRIVCKKMCDTFTIQLKNKLIGLVNIIFCKYNDLSKIIIEVIVDFVDNLAKVVEKNIMHLIDSESNYVNTDNKNFNETHKSIAIELSKTVSKQGNIDNNNNNGNIVRFNPNFNSISTKSSRTKEQLIRELLSAYFCTIKETIKNCVPKFVMNDMIRALQKNISSIILNKVMNDENISDLIVDKTLEAEIEFLQNNYNLLDKINSIIIN
jgi:hypothetical protein